MSEVIQSNPAKLQQLWQTKEYRNYPVLVLKHFRRQTILSDGAVLCWQFLHELAFFSEDWSTSISKKELAFELGKSKATACRLLNELEANGYIKKEKHQSSTRIYVILPADVIHELQSAPDRAKAIQKCGTIAPSHYRDMSCRKNETANYKNNINNIYNNNIEIPERLASSSVVVSSEDFNEPIAGSLATNGKTISKQSAWHTAFMGKEADGCETGNPLADNHALEFFQARENPDTVGHADRLEKRIDSLKTEADSLYEKLSIEQNRAEKLGLMDLVQSTNERLSSLENQLASMQVKAKPPRALREGQRQLNAHQLEKIKKIALGACNGLDNAKELALDTIEQIRFGSLAVKSHRTGKPMSVEFAVNTACKLIQENRWG